MSERQDEDPIEQQMIQLAKQENPQSVQQLVELAARRLSISDEEARKHALRLIDQQMITLKAPVKPPPTTLSAYAFSSQALWFWITILLSFATVVAVFTIPEDAYPIVYVRYVLGIIFVLWLPGYTLMKALFPTTVPIKTSSESLDEVERAALSVGLSVALVPIVGLLLNYTLWGIRLTPVILSLLALTIAFAAAALIREHQAKTKNQ